MKKKKKLKIHSNKGKDVGILTQVMPNLLEILEVDQFLVTGWKLLSEVLFTSFLFLYSLNI